MSLITSILNELDERFIAQAVGNKYDDAAVSFSYSRNQVGSESEYYQALTDFYNHMHSNCVAPGSVLGNDDSLGRALEIVENEARKKGGSTQSAFRDALDGLNGGLRVHFNAIADTLKAEATKRHTEVVFRRHISPLQWDQQVQAIRELLNHFKSHLPGDIDTAHPERYAHDYSRLIMGLSRHLNQMAYEIRRY